MIDIHATFEHEFFDMTCAEGIAIYQRTPVKMMSVEKCAPLKLITIVALPHDTPLIMKGEHTPNRLK
jgi:hypothetical protein